VISHKGGARRQVAEILVKSCAGGALPGLGRDFGIQMLRPGKGAVTVAREGLRAADPVPGAWRQVAIQRRQSA